MFFIIKQTNAMMLAKKTEQVDLRVLLDKHKKLKKKIQHKLSESTLPKFWKTVKSLQQSNEC